MTAEDPAPRTWPAGRALGEHERVDAQCTACGAPWHVHQSLAGFRLRCDCGEWIAITAPAAALPAPADVPAPAPERAVVARGADGLRTLTGDVDDPRLERIVPGLPMAPGTVRRASAQVRVRWTNRTLLEFAALLAALIGPHLLVHVASRGREAELLLPFASLTSGVLVLLIAAHMGPYGLIGLRRAAARHYGEALLAAAIGLALAAGWVQVVRAAFDVESGLDGLLDRLGLPAALLVIAVAPAVLEEIAFRGVLQGRLQALLGRRTGLSTTAAAFALCHGQPIVLPIHFGLGLYLGWLRERCGSLLPGMVAHFAYNAAVLVTEL